MILIDALYINNGGGKVLLDYLIEQLEALDSEVHYLLDLRIINNHPAISKANEVTYMDANLLKRHKFYLSNKKSFSCTLCFGNIPPTAKMQSTVYTYFHQPLYLVLPKSLGQISRFKFWAKSKIVNHFKKHTDFWLVQSKTIASKLATKFEVPSLKIYQLPFYPPIPCDGVRYTRVPNSFIYVSAAGPHKNHVSLINAFCDNYDKMGSGSLTVTVSDSNIEVFELLNRKINEGYPIKNIGFVKRADLFEQYQTHEYLIFPSFAESFGLGLVEAIENGCKVIGANLDYTYEVCQPSLTFDPSMQSSIQKSIETAISNKLDPSKQVIQNKIVELLNTIISSHENK